MKKVKEVYFKSNKYSKVDIVEIVNAISNKLDEISFFSVRLRIDVDHWQKRCALPGWSSVILGDESHHSPRPYQEVTVTIERFEPPMDFPLFLDEIKDLIKKHKLREVKTKI